MFSTTATLSAVVNGTQTVAAAALPGVNFGNLVIGDSIIKDAAGTMGLVTAINNDTDITVTTISINTPTRELTQAEYDALTEAEKDNGTIYFILDSTSVLPAAPAFNYSTEEQVVGTWIDGKPLYQKTVECGTLPNHSVKKTAHNITDADLVFIQNAFGFYPNGNQTIILPTSQDETGKGLQLFVDRTNIFIYCREFNLSDYSQSYVTLQYTKTTD